MRRIFSTIVLAAAVVAIQAQHADAQTIGFKLGAAFSTLHVEDEATSPGSITGFMGGGHVRFGLGGRIGLQAELISVTRGADDLPGTPGRDVRLEYVEIPLLLHVPLTMGMNFAPYIYGGPGVAFEVRCRTTDAAGNDVDCTDAAPFERNTTDFGLTAGGGFAFAVGPGALLLEGRYTWGLGDIAALPPTVRNRSGAVMAGYELPLGRRW